MWASICPKNSNKCSLGWCEPIFYLLVIPSPCLTCMVIWCQTKSNMVMRWVIQLSLHIFPCNWFPAIFYNICASLMLLYYIPIFNPSLGIHSLCIYHIPNMKTRRILVAHLLLHSLLLQWHRYKIKPIEIVPFVAQRSNIKTHFY